MVYPQSLPGWLSSDGHPYQVYIGDRGVKLMKLVEQGLMTYTHLLQTCEKKRHLKGPVQITHTHCPLIHPHTAHSLKRDDCDLFSKCVCIRVCTCVRVHTCVYVRACACMCDLHVFSNPGGAL